MTTTAVIEHFDVFEQVRSGLTLRPVPRGRSSFVLQTVEELFVGALTLLCQAARLESVRSAKMRGYSSLTIYRLRQR